MTNYEKYLEIWTRYYSRQGSACVSVAVAAAYAATDCLTQCKSWGFGQAEIEDDIAYFEEKVGK